MKSEFPLSLVLILCGILCVAGALALVAYHRSIGFKGATSFEELGLLAGAVLAVVGIGIAAWRRIR